MRVTMICLLASFILCWFFCVVGVITVMQWVRKNRPNRKPINPPQRTADVVPITRTPLQRKKLLRRINGER